MKIEALTSARLCIRNFEKTDINSDYLSWLADPEVVKYSSQRHVSHTVESAQAYWLSFEQSVNSFLLLLTRQGEPLGTMTLYRDLQSQVVDMGILIGNRSIWGLGYGSEAWGTMIDYLFASGTRKITAGTLSVNLGMLKIMEKHQMQDDGVRRQHVYYEGNYVDQIHRARFKGG